jgi:drug/metabolite transporter (DMT)-like permease
VYAILGGLGAAAVFATATLCSSRSTRMIGPPSVLAWVMLVGFAIVIPWAAVEGIPADLDAANVAWLAVSGLGNVFGLLFAYTGLRIGKVGVVAPIVSTEGAIAAVIAAISGEEIAAGVGIALAFVAIGVLLASASRDPGDTALAPTPVVTAYALAAAVSFGFSLYATARVSADLPVIWALVPARLAGVILFAVPLVVTAKLRLTRPAVPLVFAAGIAEIVGFALFALGSRHGIAVAAVLAAQFGAIAAVAAYLLFRERLARVQIAGVVTIVAAVSTLSALQA